MLFTLYLQKIKENGPLVRKQGVNRLDGKMFQELMIERVKNVISIEWLQRQWILATKDLVVYEFDFLTQAKKSIIYLKEACELNRSIARCKGKSIILLWNICLQTFPTWSCNRLSIVEAFYQLILQNISEYDPLREKY